jgi:hypothetical protein
MVCPPATSKAGARPLEGLRSLQINSCLGAILFDKAFTIDQKIAGTENVTIYSPLNSVRESREQKTKKLNGFFCRIARVA